MITIRVTFSDGNYLITSFNGTLVEARAYYIGKSFDLHEDKPMVQAVLVQMVG